MNTGISRQEFIKMCGLLGVGMTIAPSLLACRKQPMVGSIKGKILVIGAGVGGLTTGYLLQQLKADFQILEASPQYGGRIKTDPSFADFPIPLGAEWIETGKGIFEEIVNDGNKTVDIKTFKDKPDHKFYRSAWLNFYEDHILPSITNQITYNTIVESIDYSGNQVTVKTQNGNYVADKVIVTVPLKILQAGYIHFTPALPAHKVEAIQQTKIWSGFKAFFEFSSNFYGDGKAFEISPQTDGEKLYYDATFGQDSNKHILGLFAVGKPAEAYTALSESEVKAYILKELDDLYNGQASSCYQKHVVQNWDKEPFIKGGYMTDYANSDTVAILSETVDQKVYFAGGAYTSGNDWVSVHAAARSALARIKAIANED